MPHRLPYILTGVILLSACSDVGPGLKNHPVDCAMGIAWADCLPGTLGYERGGGAKTRADAVNAEQGAIQGQRMASRDQCISDMQSPDLDLIRGKVELLRDSPDAPVPFVIASNDTFPTANERAAIAKWATIRDECIKRSNAVPTVPASASPLQAALLQQDRSFGQAAEGRISALIIAVYQAIADIWRVRSGALRGQPRRSGSRAAVPRRKPPSGSRSTDAGAAASSAAIPK